jgi:hypothetical protein
VGPLQRNLPVTAGPCQYLIGSRKKLALITAHYIIFYLSFSKSQVVNNNNNNNNNNKLIYSFGRFGK